MRNLRTEETEEEGKEEKISSFLAFSVERIAHSKGFPIRYTLYAIR